jgi:uncharacterized protein
VSDPGSSEFFVWTLFQQLVRRDFAIGLDEYGAVMQSLKAGFGWSSREDLKQVLCAVWASSREESKVVAALFDQYVVEDWDVAVASTAPVPIVDSTESSLGDSLPDGETPVQDGASAPVSATEEKIASSAVAPEITPTSRLPPLSMEDLPRLPYSHLFLPQYPVSYRLVAQAWRRLRWPLREGPAVELDVDATVARRARLGVGSIPVLRPRRRNQANLLLLVDRKGSMAPFHDYVSEVCTAIAQAGGLGRVGILYFHDTPLEGADLDALSSLDAASLPKLDRIVGHVPALTHGEFFTDPELLQPYPAERVFAEWTDDTAIVVVSDGGAARGRFDPARLLDCICSLKGLLTLSNRLVWLNPMPAASWGRSTAGQIARHVPMLPMDRDGMHRAVNVLRKQPFVVEHPLERGGQRLAQPDRAPALR